MKLIIQIPCFNEAQTLPITLADLPRSVEGFDTVEWLVIDDGSQDNTSEIALKHGVHHVVRHPRNKGLAQSFITGLNASLANGADVIVNTDADNQYCAADIPKLTKPILERNAEIVIGARPISHIETFSTIKKILQKLGSLVVRIASRTTIPDAPSGFRAISSEAAQQIVVFSNYTYTLETIIQAGQKKMAIVSVPIQVNKVERQSRLIKSIPRYILLSVITILRSFIVYQPLRFFMTIGLFLFCTGFLIGLRFLYFFICGMGKGHIQSIIFASVLLGMGFQTILIGFVADLLAANRKLLENIRLNQYKTLTS